MIYPIEYLVNVYPTYNLDNKIDKKIRSEHKVVQQIQSIEPIKQPKRYCNHPNLGKLFDIYA